MEQLRYDQATGSGMRSNLEKEMELLFTGAVASGARQQADVTCGNATQVAVHNSLSKARRRGLHRQQKQLETVRVGTIAETSSSPCNRLASEGHSPSRVRTGGDQSSDRGSSIHATAGEEAAGGHGEK